MFESLLLFADTDANPKTGFAPASAPGQGFDLLVQGENVFRHAAELPLTHPDGRRLTVLGCYHVSQQNTFTGRLTPAMLDEVLVQARELAGAAAD